MKERSLPDKHAKRLFEEYIKQQVSIRTWQRVKSLMRSFDLTLTKANIQVVAKLKQTAPKTKTPLNKVLGCYVKVSQVPTINGTIKGALLYSELERITGYKAHRTTIPRWLNLLPNGFNKDQTYRAIDTPLIYLAAFTYKPRSKKCN